MINYTDFQSLITRTRSYRRFDESRIITDNELRQLIDLGRLAASAANRQPLKYKLITDKTQCEQLFPFLPWAGYLKDWDGPKKGERPTAYIIVLHDNNISQRHWCDEGIAIQNIMLGASTLDLGGCIIGGFSKEKLRPLLLLPDNLDICYVLALGKPAETVVIENMGNNDIHYWRDQNSAHHVPKRNLNDIII